MPEDCTLLPFRSHEVAAHLAANPLLLVGDSITQLMFESFACLLGEDLTGQSQDTNITAGDTSMWVSQLVHQTKQEDSQAITIALIRSDYLVRLDDFHLLKPSENAGYLIGDGSNFPWVHAIPRFTYIVLNTAAHWHPDLKWGPNKDRKELLAAYSVAMKKVYDYLKKNTASHQHIWIRSSPYGHAKCSQYTAPSDMPVAPTRKEGEYEWDMFPEFDLVWKKWIEKDKHPRFHYLDVSMTNHRGDAHSRPDNDCLHTCLPGPVDDWNKLLYHEMAKLIEK
ncbi:PC-esterase [Pilobolus umbonatus]|nr:PC-esterase [Pilobolus umbonatus]